MTSLETSKQTSAEPNMFDLLFKNTFFKCHMVCTKTKYRYVQLGLKLSAASACSVSPDFNIKFFLIKAEA